MKTVTMLEFREDAAGIVERVRNGERLILTYRGQPVVRLEPIRKDSIGGEDPFYSLDRLAGEAGQSLTNDQMDDIVYGT